MFYTVRKVIKFENILLVSRFTRELLAFFFHRVSWQHSNLEESLFKNWCCFLSDDLVILPDNL